MDFENIYCKFHQESYHEDGKNIPDKYFTTKIPNYWERELSTYTMQEMKPFVNFEPVTEDEKKDQEKN
jgi:hypothetical protein